MSTCQILCRPGGCDPASNCQLPNCRCFLDSAVPTSEGDMVTMMKSKNIYLSLKSFDSLRAGSFIFTHILHQITLQEIKTGVIEYVKFFELGIGETYFLGISLFIQELWKIAISSPERHRNHVYRSIQRYNKPSYLSNHHAMNWLLLLNSRENVHLKFTCGDFACVLYLFKCKIKGNSYGKMRTISEGVRCDAREGHMKFCPMDT